MRGLTVFTGAMASLVASHASAALSINLVPGTSPNVDPAVGRVWYIQVSSTTATVPLFASSVTVTVDKGWILFPDGDANGGFNPLSVNATNLNARNSPTGTYAAVPGSLAYIATNNDNAANADPNDDLDFSSGRAKSVNLISTRTGSYSATTNPFTLGALVFSTDLCGATIAINVSSDGVDTATYQTVFFCPEPGAIAACAIALGLVRRRMTCAEAVV